MEQQRETWGGTIGFVLAAAGSAIGLGNIWKFPYITGMNGGGAFVIIYLISLFFNQFLAFSAVASAFKGIQACVLFLIFLFRRSNQGCRRTQLRWYNPASRAFRMLPCFVFHFCNKRVSAAPCREARGSLQCLSIHLQR